MEGVNKPELLPKEYSPVIDVAGFLTDGEVSVTREADLCEQMQDGIDHSWFDLAGVSNAAVISINRKDICQRPR